MPILILGDFNNEYNSTCIAEVLATGARGAFETLHNTTANTFYTGGHIDYIFFKVRVRFVAVSLSLALHCAAAI